MINYIEIEQRGNFFLGYHHYIHKIKSGKSRCRVRLVFTAKDKKVAGERAQTFKNRMNNKSVENGIVWVE